MADSVYYYKPGGFKQYFRTMTDKSLFVSDALAGFREIKSLPKRLAELTVQQVSDDPNLVAEICRALIDGMQPESKYKLPYDKEERQKEIVDNIAEVFDIDRKNTQCKIVTGIYKDDKTGQQFPYAVEIAIAPRKDLGVDNAGEVTFIGSVNDTPAIDGGERYFQSDPYVYKWTDRRGEHCKSTAKEVLAEFGFNTYWGTSRRRVPSVVLINVKTNVPDWLGAAGKTHINQVPYGETIAKVRKHVNVRQGLLILKVSNILDEKSQICTSTKDLQTQYSRDFPFLKVAKGKNNFSCAVKDDLIEMVLTDADCVFQTTERNATIQ